MKFSKIAILTAVSSTFIACTEHHSVKIAYENEFRNGDIVFRCGSGMESHAVTEASNSSYSHVGILFFDSIQNTWMVIHAVPGESAPKEADTLKYESLSEFFNPMRAERGAFAKIKCHDSIAAAASLYALAKYHEGVLFDDDYSLSDTTSLYCTELVWQSYLHQGIDITGGNMESSITLICKDSLCIYPSTIINSTAIESIKIFPEQTSRN